MQKKIGQSVVSSASNSKINKDILTRKWMKNDITSRDKVLEVLENAEEPMSVSGISRKAELVWITTRNALNELLLLGLVECLGRSKKGRRGNPLLFRLKQKEGGDK